MSMNKYKIEQHDLATSTYGRTGVLSRISRDVPQGEGQEGINSSLEKL